MLGTGKVQAGAILGHDGTLWAHSPNFKVNLFYFSSYEMILPIVARGLSSCRVYVRSTMEDDSYSHRI